MARKRTTPKTTGAHKEADAVDELMRGLVHPLKPALAMVRSTILGASSEIGEGIKWNAPSFYVKRSKGWFATVNINARTDKKDFVHLILHQGAKVQDKSAPAPTISDPGGLLEWLGKERCAARFHDLQEVKARQAALRDIVRQWVAQM